MNNLGEIMIEISGELFFFQNFIMNFIILHLTSFFYKKQENILRLFLGAAIGAIYSFVFFIPSLHYMLSVSFKFMVSIIMILVSFSPAKIRDFAKLLLAFYLISFIFGGATFALFYFTDFKSILSNGVFYLESFSIQNIYNAVALAYLLIVLITYFMKNKINKDTLYKEITIEIENKKSVVRGLIDTGNSLTEPLTNTPVIIVEVDSIKSLLPDLLIDIITSEEGLDLSTLLQSPITPYWASRVKVIPFSSLGSKNGMLLGFKPDNVVLNNDDNPYKLKKVIIGVTTIKLSDNGDYKALLNPNILI